VNLAENTLNIKGGDESLPKKSSAQKYKRVANFKKGL
jgi:hypothetical protein